MDCDWNPGWVGGWVGCLMLRIFADQAKSFLVSNHVHHHFLVCLLDFFTKVCISKLKLDIQTNMESYFLKTLIFPFLSFSPFGLCIPVSLNRFTTHSFIHQIQHGIVNVSLQLSWPYSWSHSFFLLCLAKGVFFTHSPECCNFVPSHFDITVLLISF